MPSFCPNAWNGPCAWSWSHSAVVLGGVQLGLDEGADVGGALHAGQATVEDDLAYPDRGGEIGLEDVALRRVQQAGVELGLGDLAGDGCGGGDEQLVRDPGGPVAKMARPSAGKMQRLLARPVTNVLSASRTGGNCAPAAYSARPPDQVRASSAVHLA